MIDALHRWRGRGAAGLARPVGHAGTLRGVPPPRTSEAGKIRRAVGSHPRAGCVPAGAVDGDIVPARRRPGG